MSNDNLIPNDKKVLVDIDNLVMYARNTQAHTDSQIDEIAASIKEFKFRNPILVDSDNVIRAGHGRFLAAKKLGMKKVPCIYLTDMSATQLKAYGIVDNQLTKKAEYNKELLALELQDLNADQFNLGLLGFEQDSLFDLMEIPDSNESDKDTSTDNSDDGDDIKPEKIDFDELVESKLNFLEIPDKLKEPLLNEINRIRMIINESGGDFNIEIARAYCWEILLSLLSETSNENIISRFDRCRQTVENEF